MAGLMRCPDELVQQSVSGEDSSHTGNVLRFHSVFVDVVGAKSVKARYSRDVPVRYYGAIK